MKQSVLSSLGLTHVVTESEQVLAAPVSQIPTPIEVTPEIIEEVAKVAHEANRGISEGTPLSWDDSTDEIRQSAIDGVQAIVNDPTMTPEKSHNNWMRWKESSGWVFGEVKDEEAKTHPCMVPYNELPEDERVKDQVFVDTVKSELMKYKAADVSENDIPSPINEQAVPSESEIDETTMALETLLAAADLLENTPDEGMNSTNAELVETMLATAVGPLQASYAVPSAESYKHGKVASLKSFAKEGIMERATAIVAKLMEMVKRIVAFVTVWVKAAFNELERAKAYLLYVRRQIQKYRNTNKTGPVLTTERMRGMTAPSNQSVKVGSDLASNAITMLGEMSTRFVTLSRFAGSMFKETADSVTGEFKGSHLINNIYTALDSLGGTLHQSGTKAFILSSSGLGWREGGLVAQGQSVPVDVTDIYFLSGQIAGYQAQTEITGLSFSDADRFLSQFGQIVSVIETHLRTISQYAASLSKVQTILESVQRAGSSEQHGAARNKAKLREIRMTLKMGRALAKAAMHVKSTTTDAMIGAVSLVNQSSKNWS